MEANSLTPPASAEPVADASARRRWLCAAWAVHLGIALLVFFPMISTGTVAVWSTDNYFTHLPNLLFAHDVVQNGDAGLWNPYVHCGRDFSASACNGVFYPLNWPLFLLPRDRVVAGWGVRLMIELWLVGVFAYLLFREELADAKWALLSSIMYQMGAYSLYCMTVFGDGLLLFMTAGLYVVWSLPRRPRWRSMLYLALCGAMVMIGTLPPYAFWGMAAMCLFFVYRYWPDSINPLSRRGYKLTFLAGIAAAVMLATFRLLPIGLSLLEGNRSKEFADLLAYMRPWGSAQMGVSAFAPETMGVYFKSCVPMMQQADPSFAGDNHAYAFPYHGALAALLAMWTVVACRERRMLFWLAVVGISSAVLLGIRPLADLMQMLSCPLYHPSGPKPFIAVGLCALAGHAGLRLTRQARGVRIAQIGWTALLAAAAVCFLVLFRVYQAPYVAMPWVRRLFLLAAFWVALGVLVGSRSRRLLPWFLVLTVIAVGVGAAYGVGRRWTHIAELRQSSMLFRIVACNILASVSALVVGFLAWAMRGRGKLVDAASLGAMFLAVAAVAVAACVSGVSRPPLPEGAQTFSAAMGISRFAVAAVVFLAVLWLVRKREAARASLFALLVVWVLADLIPFQKVYSHMITKPFAQYAQLYPDRSSRLFLHQRGVASENLLLNPALSGEGDQPPAAWQLGANRGGGPMLEVCNRTSEGPRANPPVTSLAYEHAEPAHLFQKVSTGTPVKGRTFACGVWARTSQADTVSLLLTDSTSGMPSVRHSGSGQWEWLSAVLTGRSLKDWVKMHISMSRPGRVDVCGAVLVEGRSASPTIVPPGAGAPAQPVFEDLDLSDYRVNVPHVVLGLRSREAETNCPAVYGVRSYGGVDAMIPWRHMKMILHFEPDAFPGRRDKGGIAAELTNPRLLDLFGCRYDLSALSGHVREGALSRLMLVEGYEVIPDDGEALNRLKAPEFDPRRRVILSSAPPVPTGESPRPARPLKYTSPKTSRIEVSVQSERPGMVLFNDSYHKRWRAEVDGRPVKVIRANYEFMAVPIPAGASKVVFQFRPRWLFVGLRVSVVGAIFLLAAGVGAYVLERRDRRRPSGRDSRSRVPDDALRKEAVR